MSALLIVVLVLLVLGLLSGPVRGVNYGPWNILWVVVVILLVLALTGAV